MEAHEAALLGRICGGLRGREQPLLKGMYSSAVALELTMALTACSSPRICCPAVAAFVGLKPLSGFCLCWVIAWTSRAISANSCSRVGGLVADFKDAADSLARGQLQKSRRALTRALRECKHRTFTLSQCHSLTLRHVGVKCNLTRSDDRNA
jgi:hypothetical protein